MITAWSVERIYAGEPVPADLVFPTPACAWVNLTPGVRYLFSAAATDLDWTSADIDLPSVNDPVAVSAPWYRGILVCHSTNGGPP